MKWIADINRATIVNRRTGNTITEHYMPGLGMSVDVYIAEDADIEDIEKLIFEKARQKYWVDGYDLVRIEHYWLQKG